jgi:hypothetical protein
MAMGSAAPVSFWSDGHEERSTRDNGGPQVPVLPLRPRSPSRDAFARIVGKSTALREVVEKARPLALARVQPPFAYQTIAVQAVHLDRLGLTASAIARLLGVTDKTVAKVVKWAASPPTPLLGGGRRNSRRSLRGP